MNFAHSHGTHMSCLIPAGRRQLLSKLHMRGYPATAFTQTVCAERVATRYDSASSPPQHDQDLCREQLGLSLAADSRLGNAGLGRFNGRTGCSLASLVPASDQIRFLFDHDLMLMAGVPHWIRHTRLGTIGEPDAS